MGKTIYISTRGRTDAKCRLPQQKRRCKDRPKYRHTRHRLLKNLAEFQHSAQPSRGRRGRSTRPRQTASLIACDTFARLTAVKKLMRTQLYKVIRKRRERERRCVFLKSAKKPSRQRHLNHSRSRRDVRASSPARTRSRARPPLPFHQTHRASSALVLRKQNARLGNLKRERSNQKRAKSLLRKGALRISLSLSLSLWRADRTHPSSSAVTAGFCASASASSAASSHRRPLPLHRSTLSLSRKTSGREGFFPRKDRQDAPEPQRRAHGGTPHRKRERGAPAARRHITAYYI